MKWVTYIRQEKAGYSPLSSSWAGFGATPIIGNFIDYFRPCPFRRMSSANLWRDFEWTHGDVCSVLLHQFLSSPSV